MFRGAARLLAAGVIRDIIFEELRPMPAESVDLLRGHGYSLFKIARRFSRPALIAIDAPAPGDLDLPSYLATRDAPRARDRFLRAGWHALWNRMP